RGFGRIARAAGYRLGGQVDFHGCRGRWAVCHILRGDKILNNGQALGEPRSGVWPEHDRRAAPEIAIRVRDLIVGLGDKLVMQGLDLDVYRGEVLGFVGGSGTGKSVLTRTILGLIRKRSGL